MAVEVEELYSNLNKLLDDICKFLTDETTYEKLSPYARKQADELIHRSKKQLQDIAKIKIDDNEYDGAYVDMERKSVGSNEEDKNNIYSSVEEATVIPTQPVIQTQTQSNPYANLPAKNVSQDVKYGALSWKCRFFLNFEKIRRIYAGVHDNWLLIYYSEKDCKPLQTFDLKFHKAQPVISKQSKTLPQDFELICTMGEKKTYYFLALTHKDMLQWISHINRCNDTLNQADTVLVVEEDVSENHDIIFMNNYPNEDNEEEDIYHDIEPYSPTVNNTNNKPPDLPARICIKNNVPLPPIPQREPQRESCDDSSETSSTYDPVQTSASLERNSSFSEDGEDDIYEAFVAKTPEPKPRVTVLKDNKQKPNEIFTNNASSNVRGSTEKPKTPAKPKIFLDKSKHIIMLKKST